MLHLSSAPLMWINVRVQYHLINVYREISRGLSRVSISKKWNDQLNCIQFSRVSYSLYKFKLAVVSTIILLDTIKTSTSTKPCIAYTRMCRSNVPACTQYDFDIPLTSVTTWNCTLQDYLQISKDLKGVLHPRPVFDCLCNFLKNFNTLVTSKICFL